jgi:tetratricopeptide (TPR) repeat protein
MIAELRRSLRNACQGGNVSIRLLSQQLVILLLGLAAYSNSFQGDFVMDDRSQIRDNPAMRQLFPPARAMFETNMPARPVPYYTFAIDTWLYGGARWGYHLTNLAVHLINGFLIFSILELALRRNSTRVQDLTPRSIALAVSLLWIAHPLNTQAVTYVYQRIESLSGLFYLATIYFFFKGQEAVSGRAWQLLSLATCAAGMASKESFITAPLAVLWLDRVLFAASWKSLWRQRWWYYAGLFATWSIVFAIVFAQWRRYGEFTRPPHSALEYASAQPEAILYYLRLCVWPDPLCLDYESTIPRYTVGRVVIWSLSLFGVALEMWLIVRKPRLGLLLGLPFFLLGPTASFMPLKETFAEHRMYLPLVVVLLLCVLAFVYIVNSCVPSKRLSASFTRAATLVFVVACLSMVTFARNAQYADARSMWIDVVTKRPNNAFGHLNLAREYADIGRSDLVEAHLQLTARLDVRNHGTLGNWYRAHGEPAKAQYHLEVVCASRFCEPWMVLELGRAELALGHVERAIQHYQEALNRGERGSYAVDELIAILFDAECSDGVRRSAWETLCRQFERRFEHFDGLGITAETEGDPGAAAFAYRGAAEREPSLATEYEALASLLTGAGSAETVCDKHELLARRLMEYDGVVCLSLAETHVMRAAACGRRGEKFVSLQQDLRELLLLAKENDSEWGKMARPSQGR